MMHHMRTFLVSATLAGVLLVMAARSAAAHQPYFEDDDWTAAAPHKVEDPTVSTALYATLDSRQDVDYVTFTGQAGQRVLVGLTIPQIEGQAEFAPALALLGPGLPAIELPAGIEAPPDVGGMCCHRHLARRVPSSSRSAARDTGSGRKIASPCLQTATMPWQSGIPQARLAVTRWWWATANCLAVTWRFRSSCAPSGRRSRNLLMRSRQWRRLCHTPGPAAAASRATAWNRCTHEQHLAAGGLPRPRQDA